MSRHRLVLKALLDTFYPSLPGEAAKAREAGNQHAALAYALSASDLPFLVEQVEESIGRLTPEVQQELGLLFELLAWRVGTVAVGGMAALTRQFPYCAAFSDLQREQREAMLLSWANSRLLMFQKAFKGLKSLLLNTVLSGVDENGHNPIWPSLAYPGADPHRPKRPLSARLAAEAALEAAMVDLAGAARAGATGVRRALQRAGLLTTSDAGVNILAGATLGGGTRVNWSASFRTPAHVRREWARDYGLPAFESARFDAALDAVCKRIGVATGVKRHNRNNAVLREGLTALGAHCEEIPRNCAVADHECGYCGFGCASGGKQDASGTWLLDAVNAGARILTGAFAERVLTQPACAGAPEGAGVTVTVRAGIVVASAGALHTPALLLRSGLDGRGRVGANLRLHPGTCAVGSFPPGWKGWAEELYSGPIMSVYSAEAADWNGSGYGPILETPCSHPGLVGAAVPWLGGAAWQREGEDLPRSAAVLVLARDTGAGRVMLGCDRLPRAAYWPSPRDERSLLTGMELALRVLVAAGATRVRTLQMGPQAVHETPRAPDGSLADPAAFEVFLAAMHAEGIQRYRTSVFTAHQMGTAAMGASPDASVVDPQGQSWQAAGLYVADGSVFPTPTGVNPMVSIEATSYLIAEGLAERLRPGSLASIKPAQRVAVISPCLF
ncbi:hypothetical protein WJX81_000141 [Elliptochloris bilobata]|uniref:Long-chain-alcohol oxidase n=1 Tax=Elliptochloris bilobata TaxID=381761 RepID=A0AAW1S6Q9_9CHLO